MRFLLVYCTYMSAVGDVVTLACKQNEQPTTSLRFTIPLVKLNNKQLIQPEEVKYLGIHLDRKLTWRKHISTKRKQLDLKLHKLYWIIGRKSQLSLENKLLTYKVILKPVWTDGMQFWGSASDCNIETLERSQSKVLRIITDAPRYVPNAVIKLDLKVLLVRQEVRNYSYSVTCCQRLDDHPTDWQNLYFKEHITIVGLSGITCRPSN